MIVPAPGSHPLCQYFLSGYLSNHNDPANFPPDEVPTLFDRYEEIFRRALITLQISREQLKGRAEFDFAHADQGNFEGAIAVLRAVEALRLQGFQASRYSSLLGPTSSAKKTVERCGAR